MKPALELEGEGGCQNLAGIVVFGHRLFVADYWGEVPSTIPGVIVLGEKEMEPTPFIRLSSIDANHWGEYYNLAEIQGGTLPDHCGNSSIWGGFAGRPTECAHLGSVFRRCLVLQAPECQHSLKDYLWSMRYNRLQFICGPQIKISILGTSSSSNCYSSRSGRRRSSRS